MELINSYKKTVFDVLHAFNIFNRDSLSQERSLVKTLVDAAACFIFYFVISFNIDKANGFSISQVLINIFYPDYHAVIFHRIFNYYPLLFYALSLNIILSLLTALLWWVYLALDKSSPRLISLGGFDLLAKLGCQAVRCYALCGLIMVLIVPLAYLDSLNNAIIQDLNIPSPMSSPMIKVTSLVAFITFLILGCGLLKPINQYRIAYTKNTSQAFPIKENPYIFKASLIKLIDNRIPSTQLIILILLSIINYQVTLQFLRTIHSINSPIVNKTRLIENYCQYLIASPQTPPAIKYGFREVGCMRYARCVEMPDEVTRDMCLNQLLLSSSEFMLISRYTEKKLLP